MPWPGFRRRLRIRQKLILQFVLVAALTLGLAGFLIIHAAQRTLEARIAGENAALAGAVGTMLEKRAEQAIRHLQDAALSEGVRGPLEARDIPRLGARLKRVRDYSDLFDSVWILDPEGIELANHRAAIALRGQSFAHREYYKAVVSSRKPFLSPGFRRTSPPHAVTAAVAVPVTGATGHLLGVLVGSLDLSQLESQIRAAMGAGPYRLVLLDRTGRAIIHPESAQLLRVPPSEGPEEAGWLSSSVFLRDAGWTLTVSQPVKAALAPLARLEGAILWALLVAVVGAAALAWVVAARFTRPIEALRQDVHALAADHAKEEAGRGDELSSLRREFDRMRASIAEQAEVVAARTGALEALLDISSTVNVSLDLDTVLGQALERTMAITGADLGGIRLYDASRGVLESICVRGEWWRPSDRPAIRHIGEGISGRAAASQAPIFLTGEETDLGTLAKLEGARAVVGIPLLARGRLQGSMLLAYRRPHEFTDRDRQLLAGISGQIGTALENARLFRETREQASALQALALVNQRVTASLEPGRVSDLVSNAALRLLRGAYARVWLLEPDGRDLTLAASAEAGAPSPGGVTRLPLEGSLIGWVVRERRGRYSPHLADDPLIREAEWVRAAGYVSQLAAPLMHGEQALGALLVATREVRQFSEFDRDLLSSLASQAAIALENARLFAASERIAREARSLYEVAHSLATSLDPKEVLHLIAVKTTELLGTPHAQVVLWDEATQTLRLGAAHGTEAAKVARQEFRLGEGINGIVAQTRAPLIVNDYRAWPHKVPEFSELVAAIGVPLLYHGRLLGVLNSHSKEPGGAFAEGHLLLLTSFANQAAVALENARLFALSQRRQQRTQALFETGQAVGGTLDLKELFDLIIAKTAEHLKVQRCALLLAEVQGGELTLTYQAGRGLSSGFTASYRMRLGEGTTGKAFVLRRPVWTADILNDPAMTLSPSRRAWAESEGFRAVLSAPILVLGQSTGALVIYRDEVGPFDAEEVEFLQALASQAGLALHNARLFADLRGQTDRLESLIRVSRLIGSSLDLDQVLAAIVRTCTELLGMDAAALWILNEREGVLESLVDYGFTGEAPRARQRLTPGEGLTGQILTERRVLVSANFAEDPRVANREWAKREGLVAAAGVPLLVGDKALGTLNVFKRSPWTFSEADITLLSSFTSQAAIAIQNARLFAELKDHAEHLEERVQARTAELEEANRAKSQFLANMSHELRTPLNAIIGFSALMDEGRYGPLTERQQRFLRHIHSSGKHLLAVINDILDLTRVEAGKLDLTLEPVTLRAIIEEALTLVREGAAGKGLGLRAEVPEGLPPAIADPVRLKQILFNLLSNAVKFTPEGGTVTVGAERDAEGLTVWVRDTGIGIAPEAQERIFREFEQVDNTDARQHQGAGLGLALTRMLVELHGGRIWVESVPGKGSTFAFTLPQRVPDNAPSAQA